MLDLFASHSAYQQKASISARLNKVSLVSKYTGIATLIEDRNSLAFGSSFKPSLSQSECFKKC